MELVHKPQRSMKLFTSVDTTVFATILIVLVFTVFIFHGMSYNPHHGMSVDLPKVPHSVSMPGALREDRMQVSITRDGKVYFGSEQVVPDSMAGRIQLRLKDRGVERKVYVVADRRARWGTVKTVLDGVRSAGIIRVAFLVYARPSALAPMNSVPGS